MSSWTDRIAVDTTMKLKDLFGIDEFVETGTYTGVNARFYATRFARVRSCELNPAPMEVALERTRLHRNVRIYNKSSPAFLDGYVAESRQMGNEQPVFIYLDAHFYDAKLPPEKRFVVLDELRALRDFRNCVIAIHDFCNGRFGGLVYDGKPLDLELVKKGLLRVNPNFRFYTNTKCDIVKPEEVKAGQVPGLFWDPEMQSTLDFVWSKPVKTFRGILYAVPTELEDPAKYNLEKHGS